MIRQSTNRRSLFRNGGRRSDDKPKDEAMRPPICRLEAGKDYIWIAASEIIINKQPTTQEKLDDMFDVMVGSGPNVFPPITVRKAPEGYVLVDGRHRLACNKALGYEMVAATVTL